MNRGSAGLHRKCSVVNRDSTGVCFLGDRGYTGVTPARWERNLFFMKYVPVYHGIPAVLHRDVPWLHRHSENGAWDFQQYGILTRTDSDEPVLPHFKPRNSKWGSASSFIGYWLFKRLAKALIRLRKCAGWSEPLLVTYTPCCGSNS